MRQYYLPGLDGAPSDPTESIPEGDNVGTTTPGTARVGAATPGSQSEAFCSLHRDLRFLRTGCLPSSVSVDNR